MNNFFFLGLIVEWNEQTAFKILLPELSHVSFRVKKASKDSDLAQYTSPFRCLQQGRKFNTKTF